jgi:ketosteroid isomerase-like protein
VRGRATITDLFARFLDPFRRRGGPGPAITFEIVDRRIAADMAWDVGYYDIGANGRDGKFVVLWRREGDGSWRIYTDAYSGVHP